MIFSKKRSDGNLVTDGDPLQHITPYLMRTRNESVIYYKRTLPLEPIQRYIVAQRKKGIRITVFNVIVAALLQVLYLRPRINRFIAGRRIYEHKKYEILYAVKQTLSDDSIESIAKVPLDKDDTIFDISKKMRQHTYNLKKGNLKTDDKLIRLFVKAPRWLIRMVAGLLRFLDFHGLMPKSLIDALPFYSSIFLSHLGSIGAEATFHHLYEFGTNSVFITIGRAYQHPFKTEDGGVEWRRAIDLCFSIDERICDGFYLIRSLKLFDQFMINPELLEIPPSEREIGSAFLDVAQVRTEAFFVKGAGAEFRRGKEDNEGDSDDDTDD